MIDTAAPLLQARGLTKRFGDTLACDHIDLAVEPGEIRALLGENGAGKSTLVKMLYGALEPDAGTILWRGAEVRLPSPSQARRLGIGMVFQHFSLFEALTVGENIALGLPDGSLAEVVREAERVSRDYGLPLDPKAHVADLSIGERQRIEIVRCLLGKPHLVIMDEPTSVLTPQEAGRLFEVLDTLRRDGRSVLYITHRLPEVRHIADTVTVLRRGRVVGVANPSVETPATLARLMVGDDVRGVSRQATLSHGSARLSLKGLWFASPNPFGVDLQDVTLDVHAGEVLCIAGVAGNGQTELFAALSGEARVPRSMIEIDGEPIGHLGINARRTQGAAFVPEERLGHAAAGGMTLTENLLLTRHRCDNLEWAGILDHATARKLRQRVTHAFDVRAAAPDPRAAELSGGNLQKFSVGRELDRRPSVLVVDQPTWGVDAGAAREIREALVALAREGSAVLVVSQDLDEIDEIADRIAVINKGRLSLPEAAGSLTRERIGLLMGGIHGEAAGRADAA